MSLSVSARNSAGTPAQTPTKTLTEVLDAPAGACTPQIDPHRLDPHRPIATGLAIQRDLLLAVAVTCTAQALDDRVRAILGDRSDALEAVTVLSEAPWLELSLGARRRLGMSPDQKKVLLRLVIRDPQRTLTPAQANELRDEIYAALHEGSAGNWASREML